MADDDTTTAQQPTDLDSLADVLAVQHVALLGIGPTPGGRVEALTNRGGVVGTAVGLAAGVAGAGAMIVASFGAARRGPILQDLVRPYQRLTGADRDRAEADLGLVERRLSVLVPALGGLGALGGGAGADEPATEAADDKAVVEGAARRLVGWVAAGRPDDAPLDAVRTTYDQLMDTMDEHDMERLDEVSAAYLAAWRTALA